MKAKAKSVWHEKISQHFKKPTRSWTLLVLFAAILVLLLNIAAVQTMRPFTSDDVVTQVMIHDHIASGGNNTLWFGEDNFVIKMPFYLLTDFLFTNSRLVIIATIVIFDLAGFILFFWSVLYFLKRFKVKDKKALLAIVWLASCYHIVWYFLMNPNLRNVEIGINFIVLALFAKYIDGDFKFDSNAKKFLVCILIGLLGLFFYSDPFFTFMLGVPLLLFFVWSFIWRKLNRDKVAYAFCFVAASIAVSFVWTKLFEYFFHFALKRASTSFASLNNMVQSTKQLGWDYYYIYFADFWNKPVLSFAAFRGLLNALLATIALIVILIVLWRKRRSGDPWLIFILAMPFFISAIFVVSQNTVASGFGAFRFLVLLPFYAIFALALTFEQTTNSLAKKLFLGLLVLATIVNVTAFTKELFAHSSVKANITNEVIVDVLQKNNLSKGYAHHWDNSINAYLSNNRLKIIRVECFTKIYWLMDDSNEYVPATQTFYIYDSKYFHTCSKEQVFERLGRPAKTFPIDKDITLFVYDYDIGNRFDVVIPK